jgi:hypothetical protein
VLDSGLEDGIGRENRTEISPSAAAHFVEWVRRRGRSALARRTCFGAPLKPPYSFPSGSLM